MQMDTFQVPADPTRRRIVEALRGGELPVGDVVMQTGIHQSGVSRHLRLLSEAGFVCDCPYGHGYARRIGQAQITLRRHGL